MALVDFGLTHWTTDDDTMKRISVSLVACV